jgi:hypothetical protein
MELEKLKEIWTSLDNRIQEQEGLKAAIIKEMLIGKSDKALSRLINYGYFGIVLITSAIPLLFWAFHFFHATMKTIIFSILFLLLIWGLVGGVIGLIKLHAIDFSKSVSSNIAMISEYKIFYKRGTFITYLIVALVIVLCVVDYFLLPFTMELWRWAVVLSTIPVGIAGGYWEYKRMGMKNINSIINSLKELKELKKTDDL